MSLSDYIKKHQLDTALSDTLNQCVKARVDNPLVYMADYLLKKTNDDILDCKAYYVFDSRGVPTTEVKITTAKGVYRATCPSASFQTLSEFVEYRDDDAGKYNGRGVMRAVHEINEKIAPLIIGKRATDQEQIDHILLENTSYINVMYPVSVAVYKAGNNSTTKLGRSVQPLPILKVCETMERSQQLFVVPVNYYDLDHEDAMRMCVEVYHACPRTCTTLVHGLSVVTKAIKQRNAGKLRIVVDVNASDFLTEDNYYEMEKVKLNRDEMHAMYKQWVSEYPIEWIENPFDHEEAFELRDYYLSSHPRNNFFCLKPSQYGTVTRIKETCKSFGSTIIVSSRTGDTDDTFEYTLALELGAKYIRLGNVPRYNCLLRESD